MTKFRGWIFCLTAVAALAAAPAGARAASADDMKACAAVGSTAVRLACFDAAAKGVKDGDVAACAKVSSDTVRLACFDAALGNSSRPGPAPSASSSEEMARLEKEMRGREAAMKARIEELQQQAAEVERRAAEIERRTAAVEKRAEPKKAEPADPKTTFGGKRFAEKSGKPAEEDFGNQQAEADDPLTAKSYGKSAEKDDEEEPKRLKKLVVKITDIDQGPFGKVKVTLANGQVWKQIDSARARWDRDRENVAHIRRAFMGSFLMTINDEGAALRVRRVK